MRNGQDSTPWLSALEREAWLTLAALIVKLPNALDAQLERDESLSFFEYMVLAVLSEREDRTVQMSVIADATSASLSRLSHTVKRLERAGYVRRERLPGAGRRTAAILTDDGYAKVLRSAPAHVRQVRSLVVDAVSLEQLQALQTIAAEVLNRIDPELPCDLPSTDEMTSGSGKRRHDDDCLR
jgi:DNA-binding MarR family transcriptional regulator